MESINKYIITLVATLVFITSIMLVSPEGSMKKYIKLVLGLILISSILSPIVTFLTGGEKIIAKSIEAYKDELFDEGGSVMNQTNESEVRRKTILNNLNNNLIDLLKEKYKDNDFDCKVDGDVDLNEMTISINRINIYIFNNNVKKIQKVDFEDNVEDDEFQSEIKNYLAEELEINKDKIIAIYS